MTDRVKGFTVTFEKDMRIDDVQEIITDLNMIKGVAHIEPSITTPFDHISHERLKSDMRNKLFEFMEENLT